MSLEQLEERRLLVSRVFLDFGDAFSTVPNNGPFAGFNILTGGTQPNTLETNVVGAGAGITNFVSTGEALGGFTYNPAPTYVATQLLFNSTLNPTFVDTSPVSLEQAVTAQIRRALEPFDVEVISSSDYLTAGPTPPIIFNFPIQANTNEATPLLQSNNLPNDPGAPGGGGTATVPQNGSDDVYLIFAGLFQNVMGTAVPMLLPISAEFGASVPNAAGGKPDRLDSGGVIDVNYWITRVLGAGGTGGSLNVALGNAALYAIGWDLGLPEVETGAPGPNTNFFDPNVALLNQASAMAEGGANEGFLISNSSTVQVPISATDSAYFPRFDMMQDGLDFRRFLRPGTLGNPPYVAQPPFPVPPPPGNGGNPFYVPEITTINEDPGVTTNAYDQLVSDPDIGPNPDVQYVTGTGAFDQIFITKINATQARVTVKAFTDNTYTNLITQTDDGQPLTGTMTYTISLQKQVIPGRLDSGVPFRVIVEGCTNQDQIFLDPTLGVNVVVHGSPDVRTLNITGNGVYDLQYTPASTPTQIDSLGPVNSLIPEGLIPGAAGTLKITGAFGTTNVILDHFNPSNASALRVENFNSLTYKSPGFLDSDFAVTNLVNGDWQIEGQENSPFNPPALTGKLQFAEVKQLTFDTTRGSTSDTITFDTTETPPPGLQHVTVNLGTGTDTLNFDDSGQIQNQDYVISPTLVQPVQPVGATFTGFTYSGVETLSVTGTDGNNKFLVSPSRTTAYALDAADPPANIPPPDGDTLSVNLAGTTGAGPITPPSGIITFTSGHKPVTYSNFEFIAPPTQIIALAASSDNRTGSSLVKVLDEGSGSLLYSFYAYPTSFKGGVRVAVADVTGDGTPDVITAPGAGRNDVRVFDGAILAGLPQNAVTHFISNVSTAVAAVIPDPSGFNNGLYLATGDVDGDGAVDIITSRSRGATLVRVYQNIGGAFSLIKSFAPYAANITAGAVVAAGDVNADGTAEIITAPGVGVAATVREFNGLTGGLIRQFAGFEATFRNGVSLAAGDVDGDGVADIVLGAGSGGRSRVRVFNGQTGAFKKQFQAYTSGAFNVPLRLAIVDSAFTGHGKLLVSQGGVAAQRQVREFNALSGALVDSFFASDLDFRGGINVG